MPKTEIKIIEKNVKGLFATKKIKEKNLILLLSGDNLSNPTRTSIQIKNKHLEHPKGGFINHHCDPNAEVLLLKGEEAAFLIAKRNIKKGEEITFDYETTEKELAHPFKCNCHGRWIKGSQLKYL